LGYHDVAGKNRSFGCGRLVRLAFSSVTYIPTPNNLFLRVDEPLLGLIRVLLNGKAAPPLMHLDIQNPPLHENGPGSTGASIIYGVIPKYLSHVAEKINTTVSQGYHL
jgi:hypothetical protein